MGEGNYLSLSDAELLKRIASNDEMAFTTLYHRYAGRLYSFAVRLAGSQADATDLVQDVFAKIWERRQSFTGEEVFSSYLFSMVHNRCINFLKRFSLQTKMLQEFQNNGSEASSVTTDALVDYKETKEILQASVEKLPSRQKQIFRLHHDQGLKYSEIASNLGLSQSTVENHYSRAVQMLRKLRVVNID